jgi:hypothetical protein
LRLFCMTSQNHYSLLIVNTVISYIPRGLHLKLAGHFLVERHNRKDDFQDRSADSTSIWW